MENILSESLEQKLQQLKAKFDLKGQNLEAYLDGLLVSDYVKYWDYINLDALLSLQHPRTNYPDEKTFIIYHQITELYFRLIRNSMELIAENPAPVAADFIKHFTRINNYFRHLTDSFSIMFDGMDREQFLAFRMALMPASGFQSAQYRIIEIYSTDLIQLVAIQNRTELTGEKNLSKILNHLYWKQGASDANTGSKTLTLIQFEEKYNTQFLHLAEEWQNKNLRKKYLQMSEADRNNNEVISLLKEFDQLANVNWPMVHFRTAARYMDRKPNEIAATGGTNWKKYLAPKNQQIIFFPELWSHDEKTNWGITANQPD